MSDITLLSDLSVDYLVSLKKRLLDRTATIPTSSGCLEWLGNRGAAPNNYGYTYVDSKFTGAHRLAYAILVGDFPTHLHVLHKCDNPPCVNPTHLFIGTNADNVLDKVKKFRGSRKLTLEQVMKIIRMNLEGKIGDEIAAVIGVSRGCVYDILQGKTYKHVPRPNAPVNNRRGGHNGNSLIARERRHDNQS